MIKKLFTGYKLSKKFAYFPIIIKGSSIWLETYYTIDRYVNDTYTSNSAKDFDVDYILSEFYLKCHPEFYKDTVLINTNCIQSIHEEVVKELQAYNFFENDKTFKTLKTELIEKYKEELCLK